MHVYRWERDERSPNRGSAARATIFVLLCGAFGSACGGVGDVTTQEGDDGTTVANRTGSTGSDRLSFQVFGEAFESSDALTSWTTWQNCTDNASVAQVIRGNFDTAEAAPGAGPSALRLTTAGFTAGCAHPGAFALSPPVAASPGITYRVDGWSRNTREDAGRTAILFYDAAGETLATQSVGWSADLWEFNPDSTLSALAPPGTASLKVLYGLVTPHASADIDGIAVSRLECARQRVYDKNFEAETSFVTGGSEHDSWVRWANCAVDGGWSVQRQDVFSDFPAPGGDRFALRLHASGFREGCSAAGVYVQTPAIEAQPGYRYVVSNWSRNVSAAAGSTSLIFFDGSYNQLSAATQSWSGDDWRFNDDTAVTAVAPAGTAWIKVRYRLAQPNSSADMDLLAIDRLDREGSCGDASAAGNPAICRATDAASMKSCVTAANRNELDEIRLASSIRCEGADACRFEIKSVRPLLVAGDPDQTTTIQRVDVQDYPFFSIVGADAVTLRDLVIDDLPNQPDYQSPTTTLTAINRACPLADTAQCAPSIAIEGSHHITIDRVIVRHAKMVAVRVTEASDIAISRSIFNDSFNLGVQLNRACARAIVSNNSFAENRSNPLVLSGNDLVATDNSFRHNHRAAVWWSNPTPQGRMPSSGGTIFVYNHVWHVVVRDNEISDSRIDEGFSTSTAVDDFGLRVHGIEIDHAQDLGQESDVWDVRLLGNRIHGISGVAITLPMEYVHDPAVGIEIRGNQMYDAQIDPWSGIPISAAVRTADYTGPRSYPFADNCYAASCPAAQPPPPATSPAPPGILGAGTGCDSGYGVWIIGQFAQNAYVALHDSSSGAFLGQYAGPPGGPYAIPGRNVELKGDGTRSLVFCLSRQSERDVLDAGHLRAHVVDPATGLNAGVEVHR